MKRLIILIVIFSIALTGCRVFQPSVMLRTPSDFVYDEIPDTAEVQYRISKNDVFSFRLYSNDGFKLIEFMAEGAAMGGGRIQTGSGMAYTVDFDGTVKLPLLRRIKLEGMTIREAELFLEKEYSQYYNNPYSIVEVQNRRVIIFPGSEGTAKVLSLQNERTTLMEAIAYSGGIASNGKARKIKLVRTTGDSTHVYKIDLSKIEGLAQGNIILQANDIIYVQPVFNVSREVLAELTPIISLISATLVIYSLTTTKL